MDPGGPSAPLSGAGMPGVRECLRQRRRRCARKLERCWTRLRNALLNPDYWYSFASTLLSKWVRRTVVVSWGIFEAVISIVLVIPFLLAPQVARAGYTFKSYQLMVGILVIRTGSGLLGAFAGGFRKVGRTKIYFGAMVANIVLSLFLAHPLTAVGCSCQVITTRDCDIVKSFLVWVRLVMGHSRQAVPAASLSPPARALGADLGSHSGLFARHPRLLADVVGRAPSWAAAAAAAATRFVGRGAQDAPRLAAGQPSSEPIAPEALLELYNVTDVGIRWSVGPEIDCATFERSDKDARELRRLLMLLQCHDPLLPRRLGEMGPFQEYLDACATEPRCEVVSLQLDIGAPSTVLRACRYQRPILPFLDIPEVGGWECLCKDRCVPEALVKTQDCGQCNSMRGYLVLRDFSRKHPELEQSELEIAALFCRMTVSSTLFLILLLDSLAILMTFVVYAFMKNRCGDIFVDEDQFNVHDASSFATSSASRYFDDDDDFVAVDLGRVPRALQAGSPGSAARSDDASAPRPAQVELRKM